MVAASPMRDGTRDGEEADTRDDEADDDEEEEAETRTGTIAKLTFSLANTLLGAGILGLPKAFSLCGFALGTGLLTVFGCASAFGLHLLSDCALMSKDNKTSFRSVATVAAPQFATLIDAAVAVKCFGVATSYLIVVGDTMPNVASQLFVDEGSMLLRRREPWIIAFSLLVTPLAFTKKLSGIWFASMFSLVCVGYLCCVILDSYVDTKPVPERPVAFSMSAARNLTIFIFSFTCHQNIFTVVNEIKNPTRRRVDGVIGLAILTALFVYALVANLGYATFGNAVLPDILDNYPETALVAVARMGIAVLVGLCYPLQCHPARACVSSLVGAWRTKPTATEGFEAISTVDRTFSEDGEEAENENNERRRAAVEHAVITTVFLSLSLAIALSMTSLGKVLSIVGATGSTTVSYILPGGIYYRLGPKGWKRNCAGVLFVAGCVIMPAALILIFL